MKDLVRIFDLEIGPSGLYDVFDSGLAVSEINAIQHTSKIFGK
jgi:hypothetical protein